MENAQKMINDLQQKLKVLQAPKSSLEDVEMTSDRKLSSQDCVQALQE
jgi:hypothetical protein